MGDCLMMPREESQMGSGCPETSASCVLSRAPAGTGNNVTSDEGNCCIQVLKEYSNQRISRGLNFRLLL